MKPLNLNPTKLTTCACFLRRFVNGVQIIYKGNKSWRRYNVHMNVIYWWRFVRFVERVRYRNQFIFLHVVFDLYYHVISRWKELDSRLFVVDYRLLFGFYSYLRRSQSGYVVAFELVDGIPTSGRKNVIWYISL